MSQEIRGLFERELAETIGLAGIVDVPVLPGAATGDRPDHYVAIIVQEATQKPKGAYLMEVEIFCVSPIDDDYGIEVSKERSAKIERWLQRSDCPLISGSNDAETLFLHGFNLQGTKRVTKERSAAEVLTLIVAGSIVYEEESEDEDE